MDRKHFLKSVLLTTGGVLLGGTTIYRYLNSKENDRHFTSFANR